MARSKVKIIDAGHGYSQFNGTTGELVGTIGEWQFMILTPNGFMLHLKAEAFETLLPPDPNSMTEGELRVEYARLSNEMKACAARINESALGVPTGLGQRTATSEVSHYNVLHLQRQKIQEAWLLSR